MDHNKIGKFIAFLRKKQGLTQQELGEKLFVTDKAVSKWERGISLPDIQILNSLADILKVDVSEILNGEYGKKKNLDVEKAIDEAIENIHKEQEKKKKKRRKIIIISSICFLIVGLVVFLLISDYIKYHPTTIVNGENFFKLGKYDIEKKGLDGINDIIEKSTNMSSRYNIASFVTDLNSNGTIKDFTLSLNVFDEQEKYIGKAYYEYKNNILTYSEPVDDNLLLVEYYSKNSTIPYISEQIKKIPLKEQIRLSNLDYYVLRYQPNTKLDSGTPIFDGRNSKQIKALSYEDYSNGLGGMSDSDISVVIRLYDGSSMVADEQYLYVFDSLEEEVPDTSNYMMETDYYITNGTLKFTRDYGRTYIDTDITSDELDETLNFYGSLSLQPNSWFIKEDDTFPIAYFYLEDPVLKLSRDNGSSWENITFDLNNVLNKPITTRVVGFASPTFGYVALGTDWTMGSGELKRIYFTYDAGKTWKEVEAPLNGTSNTLIDMFMYDENHGIIVLKDKVDINFPLIYATNDGGENWQEVDFSYFNLPDEITYLTDVDRITKEDNQYYITLGQGNNGILKAVFRTNDLLSPWTFVETKEENIHTVG